jgi:hypothetical protein
MTWEQRGNIRGPGGGGAGSTAANVVTSANPTAAKLTDSATPPANPSVGDLWIDPTTQGTDGSAFPSYLRPGFYSTGHPTGMTFNSFTLSAGVAIARPFELWARHRFDRIGIQVNTSTSGSGSRLFLGLYRGGAGRPGAHLLTTADLDSSTNGAKEADIDVTLDPGIYWVACLVTVASAAVPAINSGEHSSPYVAMSSTPLSVSTNYASVSSASGQTTLPTAAETPWITATTAFPLVMLRAAAA